MAAEDPLPFLTNDKDIKQLIRMGIKDGFDIRN